MEMQGKEQIYFSQRAGQISRWKWMRSFAPTSESRQKEVAMIDLTEIDDVRDEDKLGCFRTVVKKREYFTISSPQPQKYGPLTRNRRAALDVDLFQSARELAYNLKASQAASASFSASSFSASSFSASSPTTKQIAPVHEQRECDQDAIDDTRASSTSHSKTKHLALMEHGQDDPKGVTAGANQQEHKQLQRKTSSSKLKRKAKQTQQPQKKVKKVKVIEIVDAIKDEKPKEKPPKLEVLINNHNRTTNTYISIVINGNQGPINIREVKAPEPGSYKTHGVAVDAFPQMFKDKVDDKTDEERRRSKKTKSESVDESAKGNRDGLKSKPKVEDTKETLAKT